MAQCNQNDNLWVAPDGWGGGTAICSWIGGEQQAFVPSDPERAGVADPDLRELLYDLKHPPHPDCFHAGHSLPPFFEYCPYCGSDLHPVSLSGIWLPPFGWSPFSGLEKTKIFHPQPVKGLREWPQPGGTGPLRFWICPQSGEGSAIYAYRPNQGTIFRYDPRQDSEFKKCHLGGEADAVAALRGEVVGSARSWSPVWFAEQLLFASQGGLLALTFETSGKIVVRKLMGDRCVASPAVTDGTVIVPALREDGPVIARVNGNLALEKECCVWQGEEIPSPSALMGPVSMPMGVLDGDIHWVFATGVLVAGSTSGRWLPAPTDLRLEPRRFAVMESTGLKVYAWETTNDQHAVQILSVTQNGLKKVSVDDIRDMYAFPDGGTANDQWFSNGKTIKHGTRDFSDLSVDELHYWSLGVWQASSSVSKTVPMLLSGYFENLSAWRAVGDARAGDSRLRGLALNPGNYKKRERVDLDFSLNLSLPLDSIVLPMTAETVVLYGGDSSPEARPINLLSLADSASSP